MAAPKKKRAPTLKSVLDAPKRGQANRDIEYRCSVCNLEFPRDALTVKRVGFSKIGAGGKTIKTRTVAWLCPEHLEADPAWNRPDRRITAPEGE